MPRISPLSETMRQYRLIMWLLVGAGLIGLFEAVRGSRTGAPSAVGLLGAIGFVASMTLAAWFGLKGIREGLSEREAQSRHTIQMMLIAELGKHDDDTLKNIAGKTGPASDAARLILQGRAQQAHKGAGA